MNRQNGLINMEENKPTTETNAEAIVPQEKSEAELKIEVLEADKAKLIEEKANYRVAYLKEKQKNGSQDPEEETVEEKMRRIAREEAINAKINTIDAEKEALFQQTLKENKELRHASLNKKDIVQTTTSSNESVPVRDTIVTPEQLAAFKSRGWTDKDIERYKKNLQKYGGR